MANTVQIKTGLAANLPTLKKGEEAFTTDTKKYYIGDGATNVMINPDKSTSAAAADKLTTARAISLTGDVTGSANFDGSAAAAITATLANSGVTAGAYPKVTVDAKGRVTAGASLAAADIPSLTLAKITDAGTAASKNVGTASGQVPLLDANGKLADSTIPGIAIVDVVTAANEAAMLAQTGLAPGDMCVRSDTGDLYVLKQTPASTLANWVPIYAKNGITIVNGQSGPVVTINDITGNAGSATKLATARTVQTNLASTASASFDGTANIAPGVSGVLPVANGGIGVGTLTGLVKGNGASAMTAAVAGTDYVTPSGSITGSAATLTTARTLQANLATTTAGSFNGSANITLGVTGTLPVANGGIGVATLTGLAKGNGTGAFSAAVSGTDYLAPDSVIDCGTF